MKSVTDQQPFHDLNGNRNTKSIKTFVTWFICLCALPVTLLAIYLAFDHVRTIKTIRDQEANKDVGNIAATIDRQIGASIGALKMLAKSRIATDPSKLNEFYNEAVSFQETFGGNVALVDDSFRIIFHTLFPFGVQLPALPDPKSRFAAGMVLESGKPSVSNVVTGPIAKEALVAIGVPIERDDRIVLVLVNTIDTAQFQETLDQLSIPTGVILTIFDRADRIIAQKSSLSPNSGLEELASSRRFTTASTVGPWSFVLEIPENVYSSHFLIVSAILVVTLLLSLAGIAMGGHKVALKLANSVMDLVKSPQKPSSNPVFTEVEEARTKLMEALDAKDEALSRLQESQEILQLFIKHAPSALAMFDTDMRYLAVSRRYIRDFNLGNVELIGRCHYDVFTSIPERWKHEHQRVFSGEVVEVSDDLYEPLVGSVQWLRRELRPWFASDGSVGGLVMLIEDITERKLLDDELKKSAQRFDLAQEAAKAGAYEWDLGTNRTIWSEQLWAILGLKPHSCEQNYDNWLQSIHPEDRQKAHQAVQEGVSRRADLRAEWRIQDPDGHIRWVVSRARPVFDTNGNPTSYVGIVSDITDLKQAQENLASSQQRLHLALESSSAGMWEWKIESDEVYWSDELWRLMGMEPNSFGMSHDFWQQSIHPDDRHEVRDIVRKALASKSSFELEGRVQTSNGETLWLMSRGRPVLGSEGQVVSFIGIVVDVTERKKAEQALRLSETMLRSVLENIPSGVVVRNAADGSLLLSNSREKELLGPPVSILDQFPFHRAFHYDGRPYTLQEWPLYRSLVDGDVVRAEELAFERDDGSRVFLSISSAPVKSPAGLVEKAVGVYHDITEAVSAREALRQHSETLESVLAERTAEVIESQRLLKTIVENLPVAIAYIDSNQGLVFSNRTYQAWMKKSEDEIRAVRLQELLGSEFDQAESLVLSCLGGQVVNRDITATFGDRIKRDLRVRLVPHVDSGAKVRGVVALMINISDLRKVERELRKSEKKFRELTEMLPQPVWEINLEGKYTFGNSALLELLSVTREGLLSNLGPSDVVLSGERLEVAQSIEQDIKTKQKNVHYCTIVRKDGSLVPCIVYSAPILEDGEVTGLRGVTIDISDLRNLENELRQSEKKYRDLTEMLPQPVWEMSLNGKFTYGNPAMLELLGVNMEDYLNTMGLLMTLVEEDRDESECNLTQLARSEQRVTCQCKVLRADGSTVPCMVYSSAIVKDGEVIGFRGVTIDIGPLKKAEEERELLKQQLFESKKLMSLGNLVGGLAHDFNNILQIITGFSELLMDQARQGSKQYMNLQNIVDASMQGAEIITKLLAFGQQSQVIPKPLDLNREISELLSFIQNSLPGNVEIDLKLVEEPTWTKADQKQISQIILSLVSNSSEAMPEGGRVSISTSKVELDEDYCKSNRWAKPGEYVLLTVEDTGCGMSEETLSQIFDPFFTTKQRGAQRGTGLGLPVVRGMVLQHGGLIDCSSKLGKGSEFRLYFPAIEQPEVEIPAKAPEKAKTATGTILIVEDVSYVADLERIVFERAGYRVIVASNGGEAISIYKKRKKKISLVVLDLLMPVMSGEDCVNELIKINPEVKILILSGYSPEDVLAQKVVPIVKGFVQKPCKKDALLAEVRRAIDS